MRSWLESAVLACLLVGLAPALGACATTSEGDAGSSGETLGGGEESDLVTYDNFADGFVRDWCRGCHSAELGEDQRAGAPLEVNFDTEADLLEHAERMHARATGDAPTMPPAGGPSTEELELFARYLESVLEPPG